jgi:hypothetical protein
MPVSGSLAGKADKVFIATTVMLSLHQLLAGSGDCSLVESSPGNRSRTQAPSLLGAGPANAEHVRTTMESLVCHVRVWKFVAGSGT